MRKPAFTIIAILSLLACSSFGQGVHTPERGSAERKTILDVLRVPVERELKQKIVFAAETFNVLGNWAFLYGTPQTFDGSKLDLSKTKYAEAQREGFWGGNFQALLKKTAGKWVVVKYQLGCTDVCWAEWWKTYRAPKAVFPYTE